MRKARTQESWPKAIADAAREQLFATVADGRFVTFKRRLVPADQAESDGVEWPVRLATEQNHCAMDRNFKSFV